MSFKGLQKTFTYTQINNESIDEVFPLLCPVREKDWLYGWDYKMIHSKSGLIEKDCVFTSPYMVGVETVWQVTQYDPEKYFIEFIRFSGSDNIVRINIQLEEINKYKTKAHISYKYTALNEQQNKFLEEEVEQLFTQSMEWWEQAINFYLATGKMLEP